MWFCRKSKDHQHSHVKVKKVHMNGFDFGKKKKLQGPPNVTFFQKVGLCYFLLYDYLTSWKKSEKTEKPILRSCVVNELMYRLTNRAKFIWLYPILCQCFHLFHCIKCCRILESIQSNLKINTKRVNLAECTYVVRIFSFITFALPHPY